MDELSRVELEVDPTDVEVMRLKGSLVKSVQNPRISTLIPPPIATPKRSWTALESILRKVRIDSCCALADFFVLSDSSISLAVDAEERMVVENCTPECEHNLRSLRIKGKWWVVLTLSDTCNSALTDRDQA